MKHFKTIRAIIVIAASASIIMLLWMNDKDTAVLTKKISQYQSKADSLSRQVNLINSRVQQKDSILLDYLTSLDKTLEELNKESFKNKVSIATNFARQDSIRAAFCREMKTLDHQPSECQ